MRVEINIPPSPSIVSSFLYEGLYAIRSRGEDLDKIRALWNDLLEEFEAGKDNKTPKQPIVLAGRNDRESLAKILERNVENLIDLARYLKDCEFNDIIIDHVVDKKRGKEFELVGDKRSTPDDAASLQIFKADRYETISSFEAFPLRKSITLYADAKALYLFTLGLLNSYIDGVKVGEGQIASYDYYFLLFNHLSASSHANVEDVIEGKNVSLLVNIKNRVRNSLRETLSRFGGFSEEIFMTSVLLNSEAIEEMTKHNVGIVNLKLLRIRAEGSKKGYTFKVYNEIPLSLDAAKRIYSDIGLVKKLENIFKGLLKPAGRFLRASREDKNVDDRGDEYHAYQALRYLYIYIMTEDPQFLANFYRELASAYKIVKNKSPGDALWYLELMSRMPMRR